MVRVTPVKLQASPKVLWFDPDGHTVMAGDRVIVSTERGTEFGTATADSMDVSDELIAQLKSPLKPVVRIADEADIKRAEELRQKGEDALITFKELAAETSEQMRPVMVEFLFDGDKAVFYFESEERIDFRDLVRKLASVLRVRIDMRQIGVRDGARMIGGLGHCGQELCCARLGGEFSPVSIRMAKEQNLSLNPQKISGCCGRLMCCLRYEYEAYKEVNARAPKVGATIEIPDGTAKVTEINVPLEEVSLQLQDERIIKIPLAEMEKTASDKRPSKVGKEAFEKYANLDPLTMFEATGLNLSSFSTEDRTAQPRTRCCRQTEQERASAEQTTGVSHRKPRRRRRSTTFTNETNSASSSESSKQTKKNVHASHDTESKSGRTKSRKERRRTSRVQDSAQTKAKANKKSSTKNKQEDHSSRKSRSNSTGGFDTSNKQVSASGEKQKRTRNDRSQPQGHDKQQSSNKQHARRRPGQKSSGVRNAPVKSQTASKQSSARTAKDTKGDSPRKPRRHRNAGGNKNHAK